jgi:serine/threonine protein kinase
MRSLRHENLVPFLGACVDNGDIFIVTPFCSRGSLVDVLTNEDYNLDNMFVASLIADLLKVSAYHNNNPFTKITGKSVSIRA